METRPKRKEDRDRTSVSSEALRELETRFRGALMPPGHARYRDARRVWNGMIDRRPALIARCSGTADVIAAVKFARTHDMPVSVRGGGHNVAGSAIIDGGLVIDLTEMHGVRVDPERSIVRVNAGARLGEIDHETAPFGHAVPMGVMSDTGIAGLALHGGMGLLMRRYGLTCDSLVSADLVTADGDLLVVDEHHHEDLFWALRGGGGNFGVVTSFAFEMHPMVSEIFICMVMYPLDKADTVLRQFGASAANLPDEVSTIAILWSAPDEEPVPETYRGAPVIVLAAGYAGPADEGERVLRPFRSIDTPVADLSGPMPFVNAQQLFDPDYPKGRRYYWKSLYFQDLSDEVIDLLIDHADRRPSPLSSVDVWLLGGAISRVDPQETAFFERKAPYLLGIEANWDDPAHDEANVGWARQLFREMRPYSTGGMYLNFPGFQGEEHSVIEKSYGTNYDRLRAIKSTYDPDNFFRHNMNIPARDGR